MSDDTNETKAKKLAAARRKLREYQKRSAELASGMSTSTTSVASSEKSDFEANTDTPTNASSFFESLPVQEVSFDLTVTAQEKEHVSGERNAVDVVLGDQQKQEHIPISAYFEHKGSNSHINVQNVAEPFTIDYQQQQQHHQQQQQQQQLPLQHSSLNNSSVPTNLGVLSDPPMHTPSVTDISQQEGQQDQQIPVQHQMNTMELLINEKTQLTAELNRFRDMCQDQCMELADLRAQLKSSKEYIEEQHTTFCEYQHGQNQLCRQNAELMHKLSQANAQQEDQAAHFEELQQQLKLLQNEFKQLDEKYKEKCKECEIAQLRIQQISNDPASTSTDNRLEVLTQNQFMYEQQIRDLQAMVQQFTQDKEQSSVQYQNYVQHLNAEVTSLNDRNSELTDECVKLQERERQLVDHISELEKELQKQLNQGQPQSETQKILKEDETSNIKTETLQKQIDELQERISDFEFERHEFQLKIKSQEDRLQELEEDMKAKEEHLENMTEQIAEQPDQMKLLATMESDKVAASRALTQNVELKKQLDELELRFVQLTNDKAELTNKLDAEEFSGRELRTNYAAMEEQIRSMNERFEFKDAEMIRLSHENMELSLEIDRLKEKLNIELKDRCEELPLDHEDLHNHSHDHEHEHNHDEHHHETVKCNGDSEYSTPDTNRRNNTIKYSESDSCEEAHESEGDFEKNELKNHQKSVAPQIPTAEAVEKLQTRFTYLMSQVADLTEEKQRLEHLVMQLQCETETIGEYIALYQTQRRILKQREYEKAAQARLLQEEREVLRDKIGQLNQLVSRLSFLENMQPALKTKSINNIRDDVKSLAENISIEPNNHDYIIDEAMDRAFSTTYARASNANLNLNNENANETEEVFDIPETNEILLQIQNIVTEIRENATKEPTLTVDHCHCCEGQLKVV